MAKKVKVNTTATPAVRRIAPATSVNELHDSVSRHETGDTLVVPGRMSDWLNPGRKNKPVLDPVLIAARKGTKKRKGRTRPADGSATTPVEDVQLGTDGLPRPGRR